MLMDEIEKKIQLKKDKKTNSNKKNKDQILYNNQMKPNVNGQRWNKINKKKIQNEIKNNKKNYDQTWYNKQITWHIYNFLGQCKAIHSYYLDTKEEFDPKERIEKRERWKNERDI